MIKEINKGDVLSESSHYKVNKIGLGQTHCIHQESGEEVIISTEYLQAHALSGDEVIEEIRVGKEDKYWTQKQIDTIQEENHGVRVGDIRVQGIRSIWEEIRGPEIFTVCFKKQDKVKTAKQLKMETETLADEFTEEIEKVKTARKGVATASITLINRLIANPILPYLEGELSVLRGYKVQFLSRDGKYSCVDMDVVEGSNIRPVNITTISWLIHDGVKYIVE